MQDRVPMYPGRVQLTPVPGQANTYDLIRKDEPIVEGSAYSKGNVLPDSVCDALGVDRVTAEPKDALTALKAALNKETTARAAADARKANLNSPALTGVPTAPTAASGTNTTQIATMAALQTAITTLNVGNLSGIKIVHGKVSCSSYPQDISFGTTFSTTPSVFVTFEWSSSNPTALGYIQTGDVTTTSMSIYAYRTTGSLIGSDSSIVYNWLAIGT